MPSQCLAVNVRPTARIIWPHAGPTQSVIMARCIPISAEWPWLRALCGWKTQIPSKQLRSAIFEKLNPCTDRAFSVGRGGSYPTKSKIAQLLGSFRQPFAHWFLGGGPQALDTPGPSTLFRSFTKRARE